LARGRFSGRPCWPDFRERWAEATRFASEKITKAEKARSVEPCLEAAQRLFRHARDAHFAKAGCKVDAGCKGICRRAHMACMNLEPSKLKAQSCPARRKPDHARHHIARPREIARADGTAQNIVFK